MEKHKIDRINELARKKKSDGLTDEEAAEHAALRQEYIAGFRENNASGAGKHIRPAPGWYENEITEKDPNKIIIPHSVGESQQQNFSPTPCISGTFRV